LEFEQLAAAYPPISDEEMQKYTPLGVTVVRNREQARIVKEQLLSLTDRLIPFPFTLLRFRNSFDYRYHAVDTETHMINLKKQSPVGHGFVMCVSIYCGPGIILALKIRWVN
jgi:hypothetical protein